MSKPDIVRAWKEPDYRATLSVAELSLLPSHPAGLIELDDEELARASGMLAPPQTTAPTCTMYTFRKPGRCCQT